MTQFTGQALTPSVTAVMSSALSYIKRSDIEAANKQYTPTKNFLAVFGCLALLMLFTIFIMFLWFRRQDKKERMQRAANELEDPVERATKWTLVGYFKWSGQLFEVLHPAGNKGARHTHTRMHTNAYSV
ncbi:hypothetical protein GRF29_185g242300 [Pseudopithomyces chartarum]|uniref:Uncharacterized protein n=1 Tax=Pseudopithomyces chartarum TaxID=1892770 RepID=A0AAN6LNS6_9PLEO|nr:hypothetical protein GRF29_185g242300 [Pseudopithomyces chartarum]